MTDYLEIAKISCSISMKNILCAIILFGNNIIRYCRKRVTAMIWVKSLTKKFRGFTALNGISFHVQEGEFIAVLGVNGAGKSTLLKILSGILYPDSGEIVVNNFVPYERKKEFLRDIALINPQKTRLIIDLSPMDNFRLFGSAYGLGKKEIYRQAELLAKMLNVEEKLHNQVRTLSFGERVKMEIILGLLHNPSVVFLDEPFIGLDFISRKQLISFLGTFKGKKTLIITSHIIEGIKDLVDTVLVLHKGKVAAEMSTKEIKAILQNKVSIEVKTEEEVKLPEVFRAKKPGAYGAFVDRHDEAVILKELENISGIVEIKVKAPELEDFIEELITSK